MPIVEQIPGALTTATDKEKINQAHCQWLPQLLTTNENWRNIFYSSFLLVPKVKNLWVVNQIVCVCVCVCSVCVCVYSSILSQKDAMSQHFYKIHVWLIWGPGDIEHACLHGSNQLEQNTGCCPWRDFCSPVCHSPHHSLLFILH